MRQNGYLQKCLLMRGRRLGPDNTNRVAIGNQHEAVDLKMAQGKTRKRVLLVVALQSVRGLSKQEAA